MARGGHVRLDGSAPDDVESGGGGGAAATAHDDAPASTPRLSPRLTTPRLAPGAHGALGAPGSGNHLLLAAGAMLLVTTIAATLYSSGVGLPLAAAPAARPTLLPSSLRLLAVGDWGRGGSPEQVEVADAMGRVASDAAPQLVISVGDNFYNSGVDSAADPQFDATWRAVYSHPQLAGAPWYAVAGNHDYRGNLTAQAVYSGDPRWHFALNTTLTARLPGAPASDATACLRTLFIDTTSLLTHYRTGGEDRGRMSANINASAPPGEQLAWIDASLAAAAAACRAVVVVGHHPVFSAGEHGDAPELVAQLLPLLVRYGVDAYLAGHDHLLNHLVANGTDFVLTGGGSQVRANGARTPQTVFMWERSGFTLHTVNASHISHSYVDGASGALVFEVVRALKPKPGGGAGRG